MTTRTRFNHKAAADRLHDALRAQDTARVQLILQDASPDVVNKPDASGETPVYIAAVTGQRDMLHLMLDYDSTGLDTVFESGTLIGIAAARGDRATLRLLADRGAGLEICDSEGRSPLIRAWQEGRHDALRDLLRMGANIAAENKDGKNILHLAAEAGDAAALRILIEEGGAAYLHKPTNNDDRITPLQAAILAKAEDAAEVMIAAGAPVNIANAKGISPLQSAAETGHAGLVLSLVVNGGADVNYRSPDDGMSALHIAAAHQHTNAMRLLIALGADAHMPDAKTRTPLNISAWCGSLDGVKLLMEETPAETDADAAAQSRVQALFDALFYAHDEVAEYMIDSGKIDMNRRARDGETLLQAALQGGRSDMAEKIIGAGASVNDVNAKGVSPLLLCAMRNLVVPATLLLSKGANPNLPAATEPPLHAAINADHGFMFELLLQHGANPRVTDGFGRAAIDVARQKGRANMISALENALTDSDNTPQKAPPSPRP